MGPSGQMEPSGPQWACGAVTGLLSMFDPEAPEVRMRGERMGVRLRLRPMHSVCRGAGVGRCTFVLVGR